MESVKECFPKLGIILQSAFEADSLQLLESLRRIREKSAQLAVRVSVTNAGGGVLLSKTFAALRREDSPRIEDGHSPRAKPAWWREPLARPWSFFPVDDRELVSESSVNKVLRRNITALQTSDYLAAKHQVALKLCGIETPEIEEETPCRLVDICSPTFPMLTFTQQEYCSCRLLVSVDTPPGDVINLQLCIHNHDPEKLKSLAEDRRNYGASSRQVVGENRYLVADRFGLYVQRLDPSIRIIAPTANLPPEVQARFGRERANLGATDCDFVQSILFYDPIMSVIEFHSEEARDKIFRRIETIQKQLPPDDVVADIVANTYPEFADIGGTLRSSADKMQFALDMDDSFRV